MERKSIDATEEQLRHAAHARSPVSALSPQQFNELRGNLVALLLDGPEKGQVIASSPLDFDFPEVPRRSVREQVASSPYNGRRYQLRQILSNNA